MRERDRRLARAVGLLACAGMAACPGPPPPPTPRTSPPPPRETAGCARARDVRARFGALEREGRIDRLVREAEEADALCPAPEDPRVGAARAELAAALPDLDHLLAEALDARTRGDAPRARRLYDRALRAIESRGAHVAAVLRDPYHGDGFVPIADGRYVLTPDRELVVLDGATGRFRALPEHDVIPADEPPPDTLVLLRDGGGITVRDGRDPSRVLWTNDDLRFEAASASGRTLLAARAGGAPVALEARTGAERVSFSRDANGQVIVAPAGERFMMSSPRAQSWLLVDADAGTTALFAAWVAPPGWLDFGAAFSPDGERVALHAADRRGLDIVDARTHRATRALRNTRCDDVTAVAWSSDHTRLAVGGRNAFVCLWDVEAPRLLREIDLPVDRTSDAPAVAMLAFTRDGAGLLTFTSQGTQLYRTATAERVSSIGACGAPPDRSGPKEVADGGTLLGCGVPTLVTRDLRVVKLALDPKDVVREDLGAAVGHRDGRVVLLDPATGGVLRTFAEPTRASDDELLFFVPGGVRARTRDHALRQWDLASGGLRFAGRPASDQRYVAFADDGDTLFVGTGPIRAWDLRHGAYRGEPALSPPSERFTRSATRDGITATVRDDGVAVLSRGAALVATLFGVRPDSAAAAFPDGSFELFGERALAARALSCQAGDDSYPLELCEDRTESPGALARALAH